MVHAPLDGCEILRLIPGLLQTGFSMGFLRLSAYKPVVEETTLTCL